MKRCNQTPEIRAMLAFVLRCEPQARACYKNLLRMGARNVRPDYKYVRTVGNSYDRAVDGDVWHCTVRGDVHVAMVRHSDGEWMLHS